MKILVVDTTYFGVTINREKTCEHINHWTSHKDIKIHILTSAQGAEFYRVALRPESLSQVDFIRIPFSQNGSDPNLYVIFKEILLRAMGTLFLKKMDWDIAYGITAIWSDVFAIKILSLKCKNLKTCITFDNFVPKPRERPGPILKNSLAYLSHLATLKMLRSTDMIFAYLTQFNYQRLLTLGFSSQTTKRFENGLSIDYISSIKVEKIDYDLVYLGRVHIAKGILDFIDVVFKVKQQHEDVKSIIIGFGDETTTNALIKKISDLGLESNVELKGFVTFEEKYRLLKSSRVFLCMSYDESFPVSVLEAACCHLPIVAYNLQIFHSEPYKLLNMHLADVGDTAGICEKVIQIFAQNASQYINENIAHLVPNYKKNSLMELELFRGHLS